MKRERPIVRGLVHFVWFTCKWALLVAALAALVAVPYFYGRMDDEIRARVEALLAEKYPRLGVSVRSAQLVSGKGIEIRGLSIFEPGASGPQAELLYLDEMFVFCRTNVSDLLRGDLDITHFAVHRPTLRLTRRADGSWSASKLLPIPKFSDRPPVATIEGGVVEIFDPLKNPSTTLVLRDANLKLQPADPVPGWPADRQPMRVDGLSSGDHLRQIEISATFDPSGRAWQLTGSVEGLELSPELCHALPGQRTPQVVELEGVRAQAKARFRVAWNSAVSPQVDYEIKGQVTRGRVDDPRLPYPLTDLRANFACNPAGSQISELVARCGEASITLDAQRTGHALGAPLTITLDARHLSLEGKILDMLPADKRQQWQHLLPSGEVDLHARLLYDGHAWHPDVRVQCLNVAFSYHRFPYRLERGRGTIELHGRQAKLNLAALGDGAEVQIGAELDLAGNSPTGWVEIRGDNLRLDEKVVLALPPAGGQIVRSLSPYGTFNLFLRYWQTSEPNSQPHYNATVTLNRCSLKYAKFPYPLDDVRGTIEVQDNAWTFKQLEGANGMARVGCAGTWASNGQTSELLLRFTAVQVPLDEELRDALNPAAQQLWNELKPRGTVHLETEVRYSSRDGEVHLFVRGQPADDSVCIEPARFPYRLENVRGVFVYNDGRVAIDQFKARHGAAELSASGTCEIRPEAGWSLRLAGLSVDRLRVDRELVMALPAGLKRQATELGLVGPMNARGDFELASTGVPNEPPWARWNVKLDLHQASVSLGPRWDNINGSVILSGSYEAGRLRCGGELSIDSLTARDYQLTELMGPFWIDDTQLLVGLWSDRIRRVQPERHVTAKLFGGTIVTDGWVTFHPQPRYNFQTTLSGADLERLTKESIPGRQPLSGEILASVELRGKGSSINELGGRGTVQLRNADIYQLPLMVSLLKLLSVRPPDTTAFTRSDINFYIQGEHIYVDRIDFSGDAISLLGKGEVGFNKQMKLTFHAMVGPNENRFPLVKDLLGGASQQIMLIHAEGSLDQPVLRREAFPGVSQALQQLQAEFQPRDAARRTAGGSGGP